jgi:branched-chain amino acid transport system substrate-binding protein
MTNRKRRAASFLAAGIALSVVAAACGSSNKNGSGGSATTAASGATTTAAAATTAAPTTTAASGATTTAGGATTTAAGGAAGYTINSSKCPADASQALPAGADIKIGFSAPQTGPLAGFGIIAKGMNVIFNKVNAAGGIDGHKIVLVTKDDAYDPAKTKTAVGELLQSDKIFASLLQVGTPNVAAVRADYETACVPQAYVGTGFPAWGDPDHFPFTAGGILAYNTEAKFWLEYLKKVKPGAKVAQLVYNNDFGKSYQKAFEAGAKAAGLNIVATALHEPTSSLTNEVTTLLAANPDVIIGETTAVFCGTLDKLARTAGFTGPIIVSSTCFSTQFLGTPEVGQAAKDTFGIGYLKDPTDPQYKDDPAVKQYLADVAQYGDKDTKPEISSVATGVNFGQLMVDTLQSAAKMPGGLTRVNLANAMWNINTTLPLAYAGAKYIMKGNKDAYGVEFGQMRQFDPATKTFKDTGETFDLEGQTGVYQG